MDINTCKEYGIDLSQYKVVGEREEGKMALDAALVTTPSAGIPVELLTFFDNRAIKILTAKRSATEIFNEVKAGGRADAIRKFRVLENTGYTQPYSDYANNGKADVNYNFPIRENYLFETTIAYGDQEVAETSRAKINLVADKQLSASTAIAIDMNKFYMNGVAGLRNYGLLNQPNLPAAIVAANGAAGTATWSTKTGTEIYNDIVALMSDIASRTEGNVDQQTKYKLVVGPTSNSELNKLNAFGTETVLALIKRNFPNLDVVVAPEYDDTTKKIQLIALDVDGTPTGEMAYSEKLIAGRVVADLSSYRQKFTAGTYGAVVYRPVLVSTMTGI